MAVLRLPVLLLKSALSPVAVFRSTGRVRDERESSVGRVEVAFGVVVESKRFQFQKRRSAFYLLVQNCCGRRLAQLHLCAHFCDLSRQFSTLQCRNPYAA